MSSRREVREAVLAPVGGEPFGVVLIDDEVHRAQYVLCTCTWSRIARN